jgi:hypothetical protein
MKFFGDLILVGICGWGVYKLLTWMEFSGMLLYGGIGMFVLGALLYLIGQGDN